MTKTMVLLWQLAEEIRDLRYRVWLMKQAGDELLKQRDQALRELSQLKKTIRQPVYPENWCEEEQHDD